MKHLSTILIISLFSITLSARESITGTVLDAETKRPLAFANIVVEGKNKGTVSNIEGHFVLDKLGISVNDVISFSYVGYEVLRMKVSELQSRQVIYLKQATVSIGEVNVSSKSLSAEQILKLVRKNYEKNYPETTLKTEHFLS
jgi:transketolase C-terminal domain/subunit